MTKIKLLIPIFVGLVMGQIFAEGGDRPFNVINTFRIGYDDNLDLNDGASSSIYYQDVVDLAFNASLSPRTDLMFRSQFTYHSDDRKSNLYPNLYTILSHTVSPRLLLQFSDYHRSGRVTDSDAEDRYSYFINSVSIHPQYVLTSKDRLSAPLSYTIKRHDGRADYLDYTSASAGLTWERTLNPQRTKVSFNLLHSKVEFDKRKKIIGNPAILSYEYDGSKSGYDVTDLSAGINHTFNQDWNGSAEVGLSYIQRDLRDYDVRLLGTVVDSVKAANDDDIAPIVKLGVEYAPSPQTRFTADLSRQVIESTVSSAVSQTTTELKLGAQHDFTAKIMGKIGARFRDNKRDEGDKENDGKSNSDQYMDLDVRLQYKLNRVNFVEMGYRYGEKSGDNGSWSRNQVDIGWRVEL